MLSEFWKCHFGLKKAWKALIYSSMMIFTLATDDYSAFGTEHSTDRGNRHPTHLLPRTCSWLYRTQLPPLNGNCTKLISFEITL